MAEFTVNVLGCGSAKPNLRHQPSCTVLNIREQLFMIDCGEGAQLQFQRMRLKFNRLNHIFLTHLHGDHVFGLPGLLGTLSLQQRQGTVTIHTFREGIEILRRMMDFFNQELSYELVFHEIKCEEAVVYEDRSLRIRTIPLNHRVPCVGYVVEEKEKPRHINGEMVKFHQVPVSQMNNLKAGRDFTKPDGTVIPNRMLTTAPTPSRSYAHIGDTAYMPEIASKIGPVDLLYHESTYLKIDEKDAGKRGHSTAAQAAMMARDCGARQLLLGHYSSRYRNDNLFVEEAKPIFDNCLLADEGLSLTLC